LQKVLRNECWILQGKSKKEKASQKNNKFANRNKEDESDEELTNKKAARVASSAYLRRYGN
jgi:hypothetical protein